MIVVDTNLIVALTIQTPESALADAVQKKDSEWIAPPLWESEMRNALLGFIRAGIINHQTAVAAFKLAGEVVQTQSTATASVLRIAEGNQLTAYDAEFAALAEWLEIPCLSFDDHLLKPGLAIHPKDF